MFNIKRTAELLGLPAESVKKHLIDFVSSYPETESKIKTAISSSNHNDIYFNFHQLKSSFNILHIKEPAERCEQACTLSFKKINADYSGLLNKISSDIEKIKTQLEL